MSMNIGRHSTTPRLYGLIIGSAMSALFLCTSCEKYDFAEENTNDDQAPTTSIPTHSGEGTLNAPYTPSQFLEDSLSTNSTVWCIGYIVGSTYRTMNNISFTVPTTNKTNIIIAQDSTNTNTTECIPIELKSSLQSKISLNADSTLLHECILIEGTPGKYFSQDGLRDADAYYILPNFDINTIDTHPQDWTNKDIEF